MGLKPRSAPSKSRGTPSSFPLLGRGLAEHPDGAQLCIWFESSEALPASEELPAEFRQDVRSEAELVLASTPPDWSLLRDPCLQNADPELWPSEEEWQSFGDAVDEALVALHARHPIRFAALSYGEEREPAVVSAEGQALVVEILAHSELSVAFLVEAWAILRHYLQGRHKEELQNSLLERVMPSMTEDSEEARELLGVAGELLEQQQSTPRRRRYLATMAGGLQVALAAEGGDFLDDMCFGMPAKILRDARDATDDIQDLADLLANELIEEPGTRRSRLETLALALLDLGEQSPLTSAQRVILLALTERLDEVLELLEAAAEDETRFGQAVGVAMAVASRLSHRELIELCITLSAETGAGASDPMVVANQMYEQLSQSKFADAAALATNYLQGEGRMTAALYTNALLAFAASKNRSEIASITALRVSSLLEIDEGGYFGPDRNSGADMRGSAYAWLGLWFGMTGDLEAARLGLETARDIGYSDFYVLPNNAPFAALLARDELRDLFAGQGDQALSAKDRAIEKNARDWWSIFSRGLLQHEAGNIEAALVDYQRTIEINPSYPDVYINLGNIRWLQDDDLKGAIRLYDTALALAPNHRIGRLNRAEARILTGNPKGALADAEQGIAIFDGAHARYLAAIACEDLNDPAEARTQAQLGAALDHSLNSIDSKAWRKRLRALLALSY